MTKKTAWNLFPYRDKAYEYPGTALKRAWLRLHRGDGEVCPDQEPLLDAWRNYHHGDFEAAYTMGLALAGPGIKVANKAAIVYATYLEHESERKLVLFEEAAKRAENYAADSLTDANAYYLLAFALGRYSQEISVVTALAQGLGGRIRTALEQALHLNPKHADAHIALGVFHAEVIDKVGASIGNLVYGARHHVLTCRTSSNAGYAWGFST